jgi:hypothetical protein
MSGEFPFGSVKSIGTPGFFGTQVQPNVQVFLASGNWIQPVPPTNKKIIGYFVEVLGGGSGGGAGCASCGTGGVSGGIGGSGGGYASADFIPTAFPGVVAVTVGAGAPGAPGAVQNVSGNTANPILNTVAGGTSSFGAFISATGGQFGGGEGGGNAGGVGTVTGPGAFNPVTFIGGRGGFGRGPSPGLANGKAGSGGGEGGFIDNVDPIPGGNNALGVGGGAGVVNGSGVGSPGTQGAGGGCALATVPGPVSVTSGQGADATFPGQGGGGSGAACVLTIFAAGDVATSLRGGNGAAGLVRIITFFG